MCKAGDMSVRHTNPVFCSLMRRLAQNAQSGFGGVHCIRNDGLTKNIDPRLPGPSVCPRLLYD